MTKIEDILLNHSYYASCYITALAKSHDFHLYKYIKETEITPSQYGLLLYIYNEEGVNQNDVASSCLMDKCCASKSFKDLENKGLVIRIIDENNRRSYKLFLTPKAKELAESLIEKELEWEDNLCSEVNMDRDELFKLLKKLSISALNFNKNSK